MNLKHKTARDNQLLIFFCICFAIKIQLNEIEQRERYCIIVTQNNDLFPWRWGHSLVYPL